MRGHTLWIARLRANGGPSEAEIPTTYGVNALAEAEAELGMKPPSWC